MPGLIEECKQQFGCTDLYSVLGARKTATDKECKKYITTKIVSYMKVLSCYHEFPLYIEKQFI
jgi:hypothetical protein